jgi:antitoxin component of RelBE/YafQ-DinJ toxin-antitoxin module
MKKETRISIRLSKEDKKEFYRLCETHGLCPSKIIERWIHRFNLNTKKTISSYSGIVKTPDEERWEEYNEYMNQ